MGPLFKDADFTEDTSQAPVCNSKQKLKSLICYGGREQLVIYYLTPPSTIFEPVFSASLESARCTNKKKRNQNKQAQHKYHPGRGPCSISIIPKQSQEHPSSIASTG